MSRGRWFGAVTVSAQDTAFWQDILTEPFHGWTAPYSLVNASVGLRSSDGKMHYAVRATNLLNSTTQQHAFGDLITRTIAGEFRVVF